VELHITGSTQGVDVESLPMDAHVILTGYLPDIRSVVASAWICVVPLRVGGGTRLKILEAMALGTPVVATSKGAEGLDVTPDKNILIADEPDEFAAKTLRLLREQDLRNRLADNGRRLVEEKYGWSAIGQAFLRIVENVARGRE
jgi:glycosyltransferase involved in cell wall biosynthesis